MNDKFSRLRDTLITNIKDNYPTEILGGDPAEIGRQWGNFLSTHEPSKFTSLSQRNLALALIFYYVKKIRGATNRYDQVDFTPGGAGYYLVVTKSRKTATGNLTDNDLIAMASLKKYVDIVHNFIAAHPELF